MVTRGSHMPWRSHGHSKSLTSHRVIRDTPITTGSGGVPETGEIASQTLSSQHEVNPSVGCRPLAPKAGVGGSSWCSLIQVPHRRSY